MTVADVEKIGDKASLYCPDCEAEQTFVWAEWFGLEFYGYPAVQEYGWVCSNCGGKVSFSEG